MSDFNMSELEYNNSLELIVNHNNYEGIMCFIVFIAFLRFWIF